MTDRERIDCERAIRLLAAHLDGELDPARTEQVEAHIARCRSCYSRAEFERRLKRRIRDELRVEVVPPEFEKRIRTILRSLPEQA